MRSVPGFWWFNNFGVPWRFDSTLRYYNNTIKFRAENICLDIQGFSCHQQIVKRGSWTLAELTASDYEKEGMEGTWHNPRAALLLYFEREGWIEDFTTLYQQGSQGLRFLESEGLGLGCPTVCQLSWGTWAGGGDPYLLPGFPPRDEEHMEGVMITIQSAIWETQEGIATGRRDHSQRTWTETGVIKLTLFSVWGKSDYVFGCVRWASYLVWEYFGRVSVGGSVYEDVRQLKNRPRYTWVFRVSRFPLLRRSPQVAVVAGPCFPLGNQGGSCFLLPVSRGTCVHRPRRGQSYLGSHPGLRYPREWCADQGVGRRVVTIAETAELSVLRWGQLVSKWMWWWWKRPRRSRVGDALPRLSHCTALSSDFGCPALLNCCPIFWVRSSRLRVGWGALWYFSNELLSWLQRLASILGIWAVASWFKGPFHLDNLTEALSHETGRHCGHSGVSHCLSTRLLFSPKFCYSSGCPRGGRPYFLFQCKEALLPIAWHIFFLRTRLGDNGRRALPWSKQSCPWS